MGVSDKQQNVHFRVEYLFSIASPRGVNRHYFHDSIRLSCQRFDITMHHDYIKFILCLFIKLYKQANFLNG